MAPAVLLAKRIAARKGFLAAVYATLVVQLAITFAVVYGFRHHPSLSQATQRSFLIYALLTLALILVLMLVPMPTWARFAVFAVFSVVIGGMLHQASVRLPREVVDRALAGAIAVFLAMSAAATVLAAAGVDLTWMGMYLSAALLGLIVAALVMLAFDAWNKNKSNKPRMDGIHKLLTIVGLVLFSVYVAYDTNVMLQPSYKLGFIDAAINFYLDFVNLFTSGLALQQ